MLGSKYVENRALEFSRTYEESSKSEPIFFVLSPGVDPLKDVESLGNRIQFYVTLYKYTIGQRCIRKISGVLVYDNIQLVIITEDHLFS